MLTNFKKNLPLLFVAIIFIFPMIAGTLLYQFRDNFHFKTTNHGTLLTPPLQVQYLYVGLKEGDTKKWRIIHIADAACDEQCQKINFQIEQVHKALGKNYNRVAVLFIDNKAAQFQKFQTDFSQPALNKIYLVDPLGNLFMFYSDSANLMDVLKDLKKVLEVSQIG